VIAVDTKVLVRLLVDEPSQPDQVRVARELASRMRRVHVPLVVLVELVWVMESCYQVKKPQVLKAIRHLLDNEAFDLEASNRVAQALLLFAQGKADFSDSLILAGCVDGQMALHTFDKRLGRMTGAVLLQSPRA
jgi:predicted nucleic-acid-binding protein